MFQTVHGTVEPSFAYCCTWHNRRDVGVAVVRHAAPSARPSRLYLLDRSARRPHTALSRPSDCHENGPKVLLDSFVCGGRHDLEKVEKMV